MVVVWREYDTEQIIKDINRFLDQNRQEKGRTLPFVAKRGSLGGIPIRLSGYQVDYDLELDPTPFEWVKEWGWAYHAYSFTIPNKKHKNQYEAVMLVAWFLYWYNKHLNPLFYWANYQNPRSNTVLHLSVEWHSRRRVEETEVVIKDGGKKPISSRDALVIRGILDGMWKDLKVEPSKLGVDNFRGIG